ncbi:MAG: hypothetical protein EOM19_06355 [Candidatus Moranbacteria bacterium]|nr:hypothetical protein [Candidatus Moranbacteria bacterium]
MQIQPKTKPTRSSIMVMKIDTYKGPHFIPCPHYNNSTSSHFFLVDENGWLICPARLVTKKMVNEAIAKYTVEQFWNQTIRKHLSDQLGQMNLPENIEGLPSLESVLDQMWKINDSVILSLFFH